MTAQKALAWIALIFAVASFVIAGIPFIAVAVILLALALII